MTNASEKKEKQARENETLLKFRNSLCLNQQLEVEHMQRNVPFHPLKLTLRSEKSDSNPSSFHFFLFSVVKLFSCDIIKGREINYFYIFISLVIFFLLCFQLLEKVWNNFIFLEAFLFSWSSRRRRRRKKIVGEKNLFLL